MLEELMSRMVVDARFEVTILYSFVSETFRRSLQEFLSDTLSPVCGIDTEVKDNPVRFGSVIRDAEQYESDNYSVFQIKQECVVRVFYLSIEII